MEQTRKQIIDILIKAKNKLNELITEDNYPKETLIEYTDQKINEIIKEIK